MSLAPLHQTGPHLPVSPAVGLAIIGIGWLVFAVITYDILKNYNPPPD